MLEQSRVTPETGETAAGNPPQSTLTDDSTPIKNPGVEVRTEPEEDGTYLIFEPEAAGVYLLNPTAKRILDLCDGTHSLSSITQQLQAIYEAPPGVDIKQAVTDYLEMLHIQQIIALS